MKTITIDGIEYQLTPITTKAPKPVKWEPNRIDVGNSYYSMDRLHDIFSSVEDGDTLDALYSDRGNYFHSQQEGRDAVKQVRQLLRLRAYVRESAPDWKADWIDCKPDCGDSKQKWYIYFDESCKEWSCRVNQFIHSVTVVYMPENVAKELVDKLNSGEVVL